MKNAFKIIFILLFSFLLLGCSNDAEIECDNIDVMIGESVSIKPKSSKKLKYQYKASSDIIEINDNNIIGKEIGETELEISAKGAKSIKIRVRVCNEGLTIFGNHTQTIEHSQQLELVRFFVGEEDKVVWRSSDSEKARVLKGKVEALALGEVTISAKTDAYQTSFVINIVRPIPEEIKAVDEMDVEDNAYYDISYEVFPNYSLQDIRMEVSNQNVEILEGNKIYIASKGDSKECLLKLISSVNEEVVKEIKIHLHENEAPKFLEKSDYKETLVVNYNDDSDLLSGLDVVDNLDGDIKDKVEYDKSLLCSFGIKDITLSVKDNAGNVSTFTRKIEVKWLYHTKFIGHSGSYYGVPNTEEAFLYAAKELHYQALECDLQVTSDGVYITNHDSYIGDVVISQHTYAEVSQIELTRTNSGYIKSLGLDDTTIYKSHVCTLERYLEICKEYHCEAVIEIKGSSPGLSSSSQSGMQKLVDFVKEHGMWEDTIFLTSTVACLKWLRNNGYNDVRCQYLVSSCESQDVLNTCIEYNFDLSTNVTYGGPNSDEWLQKYHDAGLEISVWTFDVYTNYDVGQQWIDKGVEYITCDWYVMEEMNLK